MLDVHHGDARDHAPQVRARSGGTGGAGGRAAHVYIFSRGAYVHVVARQLAQRAGPKLPVSAPALVDAGIDGAEAAPSLTPKHPSPPLRCSARLAYSFLFVLAILISWAGRDLAKPLIEKIPCARLAGPRAWRGVCAGVGVQQLGAQTVGRHQCL